MNLYLYIFIFFISSYSYGQELTGTWYMVNRSGLVETAITKDSITFKQIFANFKEKRNSRKRGIKIIKKVKQANKTLFVYQNVRDSTNFFAMSFSPIEKNNSIQLIWNVVDRSNTIKELIALNENDKMAIYGYNLYSKEYIGELKKRKSIASMSLIDFENYLSIYFEKLRAPGDETAKLRESYMGISTYNMQIISQSLLDLNYNPIQDTETVGNLYEKYIEEPEIKKYIAELKPE